MGLTNPAHSVNELNDESHTSTTASHTQANYLKNNDEDDESSGCFSHHGPLSPDSEYDETLAFPDSVTILSMGGNPILVERKDDDAESVHQDVTDIPFTTVYKPPVKFKSIQRKVFIPGVEIHVQIIDNERSITTHLLNPNL